MVGGRLRNNSALERSRLGWRRDLFDAPSAGSRRNRAQRRLGCWGPGGISLEWSQLDAGADSDSELSQGRVGFGPKRCVGCRRGRNDSSLRWWLVVERDE